MDTFFVGRQKEREFLSRSFKENASSFIPVYGRRRVGKSRLILEFLKDKQGVYFVGKKSPASLQIKEFLAESAQALNEPVLARISAENWREAFISLWDQWKRNEKLVIALDEFQWIAQTSPEILSIIQELWDRKWRDSGKIFLILCGSYMGFMEKKVLGRESPLFGRRTGQILLQPFSYREAGLFHPHYSIVDKARVWFLCGGIPLYLGAFSERCSVEMNIRNLFLDEHAFLFREAEYLLREELREVEHYHAVLMAMAAGACSASDIAQKSLVQERVLNYYLQNLMSLGYVARKFPLIGLNPSQKKVRYIIADPLLRFWFRFVYPNMSHVILHGSDSAFVQLVKPDLEQYSGYCFENLCREALGFIYRKEGVAANYAIGEYWDKQVQIDVVGYREDNVTDLCKCKWSPLRSVQPAAKEIVQKTPLYPNARNASINLRIFVRSRPKRMPPNNSVVIHSLQDLYE
jgi:hypothetical protein